jgi:transcriptional regulator with XRE-family HTH domain
MLVELGRELRKARAIQGMSLEAAAGPAGISATYLHKLERGVVNNPSPRILARIAVSVGVSYFRLMELAGYLDELQIAEARLRGGEPRPHPLSGQRLSPEEWRAVGDFIKKLIHRRGQGEGEADPPDPAPHTG